MLPVAATGGDDYVQVYNGAPTLCIWGNLHVVDAATVSGYAQTESDSGVFTPTHFYVLGLHQWNVYGVGWSPSQPSGTLVAVF